MATLHSVLSRHRSESEPARRTSTEVRDAVDAVLSPVLSRTREAFREEHAHVSRSGRHVRSDAGDSDSTQNSTIPAKRSKLDPVRTFKATAQAIHAITHPVHLPKVRGGEGVRRLVECREKDQRFLGMSVEYWDISLFSIRGRAWPMLPQFLYILYSTLMVAIVCTQVNNYQNVREFAALQFPLSTLGLALFLLLSFRTNSSYERWWEGRKCWDGINVHIQDSVRIALGWVAPKSREISSNMIRWLLVFAFVAKKALRVESDYPELAGIISQAEINQLEAELDPIELTLQRLTEFTVLAERAGVPIPIYAGLDGNLKALQCSLTSALRIMSTPMPFAYIVHLRSFMLLWLAGLPFAFVSTLGWWSILVCSVVGYELLGFETIGVEIENPFGRDYNDLPLDMITTELFVKLASALGKLGHMVDVGPMLVADPMNKADYIHKRHQSLEHALHSAEIGTAFGKPDEAEVRPGGRGGGSADDDGDAGGLDG